MELSSCHHGIPAPSSGWAARSVEGGWMRFAAAAVGLLIAGCARGETCSPIPMRVPHGGFAVLGTVVDDFDQDGRDDVVIVSDCADIGPCLTARFYSSDGAGVLVPGQWEQFVSGLPAPGAADLDGVNGPDLVFTTLWGGTVEVHPSRGDGSFGSPVAWPVGPRAFAAAVGDLDGDGLADIAATDDLTLTVNVLLNQGGASFSPPVP